MQCSARQETGDAQPAVSCCACVNACCLARTQCLEGDLKGVRAMLREAEGRVVQTAAALSMRPAAGVGHCSCSGSTTGKRSGLQLLTTAQQAHSSCTSLWHPAACTCPESLPAANPLLGCR